MAGVPRRLLLAAACAATLFAAAESRAQTYLKLNGLYALAGVINPQAEFRLSHHSTFQTEIVCSPWRSVAGGHHMLFGIFMNEYRWFLREHNRGLWFGGNAGLMVFNMSRPQIAGGRLSLQNRYCKGYGFMFGVAVGYEYRFCERWLLDAFAGFAYTTSYYNGYSLEGEINMHPHRPSWKEPEHPDPFNGSAEWLPNKIGLSIGYLIFKPKK